MQKSQRKSRAACVALLGAALAAATGCSSKAPPPAGDATTPGLNSKPAGAAVRQDTISPSSGSIHIDEKIMKACGDIPDAHFAFDSAAIQGAADAALNALARCFVTGPLKGHSLKLIGHADPRGEHEYNFALGQRRAGSVSTYLSGKGLEAARIQSSSMGDTEATGSDEAGWARDRKVDALLAN